MKNSRLLTILLAIAAALVLLTGAIALPILCRPFYYAHIGPLHLTEQTGLTEEEIRTAYDEMLDYCLGAEEFSTGVLRWSQSGKDHFTDVRGLFLLDLWVLWGAAVALAVLLIAARLAHRRPARLLGREQGWGWCFWRWAAWPPWTLTGPSWCSTPCSSPARTTGCLIRKLTRSSPFCPRSFSATVPS